MYSNISFTEMDSVSHQGIQRFDIPTVLKLQDVTLSICQLLSNEFACPIC